MGTTFSTAAVDQPDARTLEELEVIGTIIRTDLEETEQAAADQAMPRDPDNDGLVEDTSEVPSPTTPDLRTGMAAADAKDPSAVLSEAAKKAYMCYQRSAAESAAHQSTAKPAVEQENPLEEAGQEQQKADVEASAPALGNSHRSRKRQMKQAASQATSQEFTPGKRRRREYERLLQYTHAICDAPKVEGSARKRQKPAREATPAKDQRDTPAKKQRTPRCKSAGWEYVGLNLAGADVPQEDRVTCLDGQSYPRSMTCKAGDLLLDEYLDKTDDDQLYVVEAIIDERRRGKKREFRIKWEGFEMNPDEWIPYSNIKDIAELDTWEAKLGIKAQ